MQLVSYRRRKTAQDISAHRALIAAPASLGTAANGTVLPASVVLRAPVRIAVSFSVPVGAGLITVSIAGRAQTIPALAANRVHRLDVGERGQAVTVRGETGCPAGTVTVHVLDEWMRPRDIATGTVT